MVNQVVLVGRITRDIEMKVTSSNREVVSFSIAVNRNFKNANGEYDADFINCVAFGQQAKFMDNYLSKGRLISVVGRISTRNYENNQGQRVYVTEVIVDQISPLESRNSNQGSNQSQNDFEQPVQNNNGFVPTNQQPMQTQPQKTEKSPYDFISFDDVDDTDLPF